MHLYEDMCIKSLLHIESCELDRGHPLVMFEERRPRVGRGDGFGIIQPPKKDGSIKNLIELLPEHMNCLTENQEFLETWTSSRISM